MARIASLTHHGLGRTGDGTLVPRALPGEEVELLPDGTARILSPVPERVAAPCRHFRACGGCTMQHASDAFVARWKAGIVEKALSAQGIAARVEAVETSPPQSRRRAKLSGWRTKKGATVGFHARASDMLVEVPDCRLLLPGLVALIPALEEITVLAATRKGEVGLTVTQSRAGPDVWIDTDKPLDTGARVALAALAQRHRLARLVWRDEPVVTLHPPVQRFGTADVVPPPGAFLQATSEGEAALVAAVRRGVGDAARVVDLFAGCGTFALPLAAGAEVHAVEGDAAMLAALDRGWRGTPGLRRVTTEARDLFRRPLLGQDLRGFDAAVIDPPRAGAEAQVAALAASDMPRVAMVSCSPATFARDAATLVAAGFAMRDLRVVDQFRWSPHVEVAALFTRP